MKEQIKYISDRLFPTYDERESRSIARYIVEELSGFSYTDILVKDTKFSADEIKKIEEIITRLINEEPLQYVLGYSYFCGVKLVVNKSVLIPRPETEELCNLIIEEYKNSSPRILDVCTGSGAIALALKNGIEFAHISGVDVSEEALDIAETNKNLLKKEVSFFKYDVIKEAPAIDEKYDIIVSNPPYICEFEKRDMMENVLNNEPHIALFVEDDNPLVFYDKIAELGNRILTKNGKLFFEINPLFHKELALMLKEKGYGDIEIKKDINNNLRFAICKKVKR